MSEANANSTPAAGAAATPPSAGTQSAPNTEGAAPAAGVEKPRFTVEVKNGIKTVTMTKTVPTGPKAVKPAPAAGASSPADTAGKADVSAPAKDGGQSTTAPPPKNSSPPADPKSTASAKPDEPSSAAAKKPDEQKPPLSKAYAALLDREARITADQQTLKTERAAFEAERTTWTEAKELGKTSKLKAIEKLFGWDLKDLQDEYINSLEGTATPEQIAERAARRLLDEQRQADKVASDKAEQDRKTETERQHMERVEATSAQLNGAFAELVSELDAVQTEIDKAARGVGVGVTPIMIIAWWAKNHDGQFPTDPHATLRAYEAELRAIAGTRGFAKAAPAPAVPQPEPEKKTGQTVRPKTSATTVTSDDAGDVPIRANGKLKETATERAARLVRERVQRASN